MDFLKAILGDDLYSQVETKVNAYNADEANKDKQVKIGNLASGEYTSTNKSVFLIAILFAALLTF